MHRNLKRLLPFFVLIILILIVYLTNAHEKFSLENLRKEHANIQAFVDAHPILSPLIYMGIYIVSICLVIPDSTILTVLAGTIFPFPLALMYAVISETIGAIIFFSIFHGAFGKSLISRERPFLLKMRKQFRLHAPSYLLFLRVSHVVPFWMTNTAAAYFRIPYWTFIWTCFLGVIPLTFILADAGHSLSYLFAKAEPITLEGIFTSQLKLSLFLMGLLALFPILYRKFKKKRKWRR